MIIFVDVNLREIHVYAEDGLKKIAFHNAHTLESVIGNKKVRYITNIVETTPNEIANLVRGISGQQPLTTQTQRTIGPDLDVIIKTEYLHSISKGTLLVSDLGIRFDGSADCKPFNEKMKEQIKQSPIMRNLIKKGTLEIVGEQRKNELLIDNRKDQTKQLQRQSARDASLDAIIMKEKVGDWDGNIGMSDSAIEININPSRIGGGSAESHGAATMSDLQDMIDGTA
jgi:hypothetical protein